MKRFVSILLALTLCLSLASVAAFAEAAPSKTRDDMTQVVVKPENPDKVKDGAYVKVPSTKEPETAEEKAEAKKYEESLEICDNEVKVLAETKTADKYFTELKNKDGEAVELKDVVEKVLGIKKIKDVKIHEFAPIVAGGFEKGCGDVELELLFPTPYEKDEKLVVMIGIVTENKDGSTSIQWYALEGKGLENKDDKLEEKGRISVTLTEEILLMVQDNKALIAVVSD